MSAKEKGAFKSIKMQNQELPELHRLNLLPTGFNYRHDEKRYPESAAIGKMSITCTYCQAKRFPDECSSFCCADGKVKLTPLPQPEEPLRSMLENMYSFTNKTNLYNSAFELTEFTVVDGQSQPEWCTYKVKGEICHKIGNIRPRSNAEASFIQVYFIKDREEQLQRRLEIVTELVTHEEDVESLQNMLHKHNAIIKALKNVLRNVDTKSDLEIVVTAEPTNGIFVKSSRDIELKNKTTSTQRVDNLHRSYDALQYPLMFSHGEDGYHINIKLSNPEPEDDQEYVSCKQFYTYRLMVRDEEESYHILKYGMLLNQFLVDMYAKVETEQFNNICSSQLSDANSGNSKLTSLSATFIGSDRYWAERIEDAMVYVRENGRADLFITFTCNPKWVEMGENLFPGQKQHYRKDIESRVFYLKYRKLIKVLKDDQLFGEVKCYTCSVEWQSLGLPHVHLLLWLKEKVKIDQVHKIIWAKLPNDDQDLYELVKSHMTHGPCKKYPCWNRYTQACKSGYPKPLHQTKHATIDNGTVKYQRERKDTMIVPYNPVLLKIFDAHINVEYCHSEELTKTRVKYMHKGSTGELLHKSYTDLNVAFRSFQQRRSINSNEAVWNIFGFPIHDSYPTVTR